MKAIMVMFDSLNRHFLPPYGGNGPDLPNFRRLAERCTTFDSCYAGSMPCMPARREMHTGRHNFLHRGWGPLEPFDDSVPQMLGRAGVHTHLATDHQHYWEDGGATYHNRYTTYEFFRGQEGDAWKGQVADPEMPETLTWRRGPLWRQDLVNRQHMEDEADHSQTRTFDAGLAFIDTNHAQDGWFLQVECFDPHEPFFVPDIYRDRVGDNWSGPQFDWPDYRRVAEGAEAVGHLRHGYEALLTMCDASLGRVLDTMDRYGMWEDTALIVCTDHGFLLGERGWYGKNIQPWWDETIHTPLFFHDPREDRREARCDALVQTIDFGPTLLDLFGVEPTADMQGVSLARALDGEVAHETALFGGFGGHVSVTDGRHVYMRAPARRENTPLEEFTLMPTRMNHRFEVADLQDWRRAGPFSFTKGCPVMATPGRSFGTGFDFGTLLYDIEADPAQTRPLNDPKVEMRMINLLVEAMRVAEAPASQFERLGLPATGEVTEDHLQIARQWEQVQAGLAPRDWTAAPLESFGPALRRPLSQIAGEPGLAGKVGDALGVAIGGPLVQMYGHLTPWHLSVMLPAMTPERLRALDAELA